MTELGNRSKKYPRASSNSRSTSRTDSEPIVYNDGETTNMKISIRYNQSTVPFGPQSGLTARMKPASERETKKKNKNQEEEEEPQDMNNLYVYAYVTSTYMRYKSATDRDRIMKLNPTTLACDFVLQTTSTVPCNTWIHIDLVSMERESRGLHATYTTLAKSVVDLRSVALTGRTSNRADFDQQKCAADPNAPECKCVIQDTRKVKVMDVYSSPDYPRDVGTLSITLHPDTATQSTVVRGPPSASSNVYRIPTFKGWIDRPDPKKRDTVMLRYAKESYQAIWGTFPSAVTFPGMGNRQKPWKAQLGHELVYTPMGPIPMVLYYAGSQNVDVQDAASLVDSSIRNACLCMGLNIDEFLGLDNNDPRIVQILSYSITALGRLLGYTPDERGASYSQPMASNDIGHASVVCVELSVLCGVVYRAMRTTRTRFMEKLRPTMNRYKLVHLSCSGRSSPSDEPESELNSQPSRHALACLVPLTMFNALELPLNTPGNKSVAYSRDLPQFMEVMADNVFDSRLKPPGMKSNDEAVVMFNLLPAEFTFDMVFGSSSEAKAPLGPYVGTLIKMYAVDDLVIKEYTPLSKKTNQWSVGMPMREFGLGTLSSSEYRLYCPKPILAPEELLAIANTDFEETRHLSAIWSDRLSNPLSDSLVARYAETIRRLPANTGWRFAFYDVNPEEAQGPFKQDAKGMAWFDQQLASDTAISNAEANKKRNGISNIRTQILERSIDIVSGVTAVLVLLTYSTR